MARFAKRLVSGQPVSLLSLLVCVAFTTLVTPEAAAQKSRWGYERIEEDWELVLATPDDKASSPQIELQMKPDPASPLTGMFLINYHDTPAYLPGGVQIQMWNGETNIGTSDYSAAPLATPDEVIPFTLYMDRTTGCLRYGVCAGQSTAWGDLSTAPEPISVEVPDSATTFPNYDTSFSLRNAQIICGSTRVKALRLIEVRKYHSKGNTYDVDSTIHQVYP